jgi:hypothetical protein
MLADCRVLSFSYVTLSCGTYAPCSNSAVDVQIYLAPLCCSRRLFGRSSDSIRQSSFAIALSYGILSRILQFIDNPQYTKLSVAYTFLKKFTYVKATTCVFFLCSDHHILHRVYCMWRNGVAEMRQERLNRDRNADNANVLTVETSERTVVSSVQIRPAVFVACKCI